MANNREADTLARRKTLLVGMAEHVIEHGSFPDRRRFRVAHEKDLDVLDGMENSRLLLVHDAQYHWSLEGLKLIASHPVAHMELARAKIALVNCKRLYRDDQDAQHIVEEVRSALGCEDAKEATRTLWLLGGLQALNGWDEKELGGIIKWFRISESVLRIDETVFDPTPISPAPVPAAPAPKAKASPALPDFGTRWRKLRDKPMEGGQGLVFEVEDVSRAKAGKFALKCVRKPWLAQHRSRFEREASVLRGLDHPNIVKVHDVDLESRTPYLVMDYIPGGSLKQHERRMRANPLLVFSVFETVCRAVAFAHTAGIVHRDLKPANILMRRDDDPVITDFGICYVQDDDRHTETEEAVGARWYMAPELAHGRADDAAITPRCDVYSLGKVLYRLLSGKIFDREKHRDPTFDLVKLTDNDALEHVNLLLDKTIVEDPANRLADAGAFADAVAETRRLVLGDYRVVRPEAGQRCLFCGIGRYVLRSGSFVHIEAAGNQEFRTLVCGHCGNVLIFYTDSAAWGGGPWGNIAPDPVPSDRMSSGPARVRDGEVVGLYSKICGLNKSDSAVAFGLTNDLHAHLVKHHDARYAAYVATTAFAWFRYRDNHDRATRGQYENAHVRVLTELNEPSADFHVPTDDIICVFAQDARENVGNPIWMQL